MSQSRGPTWGPLPLPEFLTSQLAAHGYGPGDAAKCAADLRSVPGRAATASLFVDLGSCKFLEGDLDGAVAAWRQAITSDHDAAAARALLNMGLMYEHLHLFPRARTVLASVADRSVAPHEVPAALALARCQSARGEVDAATETVARLAAATMADRPQAPELSEILLALGDLAQGADRPDRAERSWRVAVAGPDSPARRVAASRLLQLSLALGHDDEFIELLATDDAEQSIAGVVLDRADGLLRLGHEDRAYELLAALEGQDLTSTERFRLAEFRVHLGQVNDGIDELEILLGSPVPEIWQRAAFLLGSLYLDYEMPEVAAEMFDRVRSHPDRYWASKAALARGDLFAIAADHESAAVMWAEAAESEVAAVRASARDRQNGGLVSELESSAINPDAEADVAPPVAAADEASEVAVAERVAMEPEVVDLSALEADEASEVVVAERVAMEPEVVAPPVAAADEASEVVVAERVAMEPEVVDLSALEADEASEVVVAERVAMEPEVVDLSALQASETSEVEPQPETSADESDIVQLVDPLEDAESDIGAGGDNVISLVQARRRASMSSAATATPEPVVVVLEPLGIPMSRGDAGPASEPTGADSSSSVFARLSDLDQPVELADEVGSYYDPGISDASSEAADGNPYASLAPEGYAPATPTGNPYAELAPGSDDDGFTPADDVEPGDWQSMLEDWPEEPESGTSRSLRRKRPSAFSRYT